MPASNLGLTMLDGGGQVTREPAGACQIVPPWQRCVKCAIDGNVAQYIVEA